MRREVLVTLIVVAGITLTVGLFFVFRDTSDEGEATPAPTTTAAATTEAATTEATTTEEAPPAPTLEISVVDGKPDGGVQHLTVNKDDEVTVHVTSDSVSDEVHVHGYDLMQDVAPAAPATISFTADIAGRFEIELESAGTPIGELEVR